MAGGGGRPAEKESWKQMCLQESRRPSGGGEGLGGPGGGQDEVTL